MPIKPENKNRYPFNWGEIVAQVQERSGGFCEICGAENGRKHPVTGSVVVLTVMHLDHQPENCDLGNLVHACQWCHNGYDADHRSKTRHNGRVHGDGKGQIALL